MQISSDLRNRLLSNLMVFHDITVTQTQYMWTTSDARICRGGPDYPDFESQVLARHCHGAEPTPVDERPWQAPPPSDDLDTAIWCGNLHGHFGHIISDFGMRVAQSAHLIPDVPLLFSVLPGEEVPPRVFWIVLSALKVDHARVRLVTDTIRVGTLLVLPQAERLHGGGPSSDHLDFMDALTKPAETPTQDAAFGYVSRARLGKRNGIAGEAHLDDAVRAAGGVAIYPESLPLSEQLALYGGMKKLIFAEGSSLHVLQLLGRLDVDVAVLPRRIGSRLAEASLSPRVKTLAYIEAMDQIVYGTKPNGTPRIMGGLAIYDSGKLVSGLKDGIGVDISGGWQEVKFRVRAIRDFHKWLWFCRAAAEYDGYGDVNEAMVRKSVEALGPTHYVGHLYASMLPQADAAAPPAEPKPTQDAFLSEDAPA